MSTAKLTSKGQITIPSEVRKKLRLKAGDKIAFYETANGEFAFVPKTGSISDLRGILQKLGYAPLGYAPTVEEMNEDIMDHLCELDDETRSSAPGGRNDGQAA